MNIVLSEKPTADELWGQQHTAAEPSSPAADVLIPTAANTVEPLKCLCATVALKSAEDIGASFATEPLKALQCFQAIEPLNPHQKGVNSNCFKSSTFKSNSESLQSNAVLSRAFQRGQIGISANTVDSLSICEPNQVIVGWCRATLNPPPHQVLPIAIASVNAVESKPLTSNINCCRTVESLNPTAEALKIAVSSTAAVAECTSQGSTQSSPRTLALLRQQSSCQRRIVDSESHLSSLCEHTTTADKC